MKTIIKTLMCMILLSVPMNILTGCSNAQAKSEGIIEATNEVNKNRVYICTGPKSKRYHATSKCRGLERCSGEIIAVSISDAQVTGKTPCKMCYKHPRR